MLIVNNFAWRYFYVGTIYSFKIFSVTLVSLTVILTNSSDRS